MSYAYLFKYIIIGDTGEWKLRLPLKMASEKLAIVRETICNWKTKQRRLLAQRSLLKWGCPVQRAPIGTLDPMELRPHKSIPIAGVGWPKEKSIKP